MVFEFVELHIKSVIFIKDLTLYVQTFHLCPSLQRTGGLLENNSYLKEANTGTVKKTVLFFSILLSSGMLIAQASACSCCTENHKAFDFWLGSWEVTLPDGRPAGENLIEKIQGGCLLRENWRSSNPGFTGTSYNYYDPGTDFWEQLWIDSSGTILKLKGKREGDRMVLRSAPVQDGEGRQSVQQITWTILTEGKVRQVWEVFQDGVSTQVVFDGLYSPKKE